jgi:hypothetical protein
MKKLKALLLLILLAALPYTATAAPKAPAPKVIFTPPKAGPGDLLLITVKNMKGPVTGTFNNKRLHFNPSGNSYQAVLGIDLFTKSGKYRLVLAGDNVKLQRDVKISKKDYPIQRLTLPKDMVVLSPENEARVEREQKIMAALWPVDSVRIWNGGFIDPLPGKKLGSLFGVRRIINDIPKNPHSGVDVTADEGEPVLAPNDGVVVLVDEQFYSGKSVVLDHGQGIYTMFFHLSKINVSYGQAVMKADVIGLVGSTGRVSGAHLHWGVRVQGARVDPLGLIRLKVE